MGQREIIVDSFAGGGGASLGISIALGRCPDVAINHDAKAIAMHAANHPSTTHFTEDVWRLSPRKVTRSKPVGLLWASPDCFPAGTLVLTSEGYVPIEQIKVGDLVLTHQSRWRPVVEVMSSVKATRTIRGHGHPGLTVSSEHPFFAVHRQNTWDNQVRQYRPTWSEPAWIRASELTGLHGRDANQRGHYWATPTFIPPLPVPEIGGRGMRLDGKLIWLAGRYIADGWTRLTENRAELVICCGKHEFEKLRAALAAWPREGSRAGPGELAWHHREARTEVQFSTNHRGLVEWLRLQFGHLATEKRIPGWVYGMAEVYRRELMNGYLSGDGWATATFVEATTVSRALAFGIKTLAATLGHVPTVYLRGNSSEIEGRPVRARPAYRLRWRNQVDEAHDQAHVVGDHLYTPIREIANDEGHCEVFNIGVAEDESYIADGIVVHNCKHFSRAKGGKPVSKNIRSLAWVVIKWAAEASPRLIILENVREFEDWGPLLPAYRCAECQWRGTEGQAVLARTRRRCPRCESLRLTETPDLIPDPSRKGLTFRRFVGRLRGQGYAVEWRTLNAADYGAPTHRRRLFLVARNDGAPVVWPERTHGDPAKISRGADLFGEPLKPWRTAAECIDWSIPCPSIFDRKRPLAEATMRRIALGVKRYVLENPRPFLVTCNHGGPEFRGQDLGKPLPTVTASRDAHGIVTPLIASLAHGGQGTFGDSRSHDVREPMRTIHAGGGNHAVVAPCLARIGQAQGNGKYANGVDEPLTTIVSKAEHLLIAPTMVQTGYGERPGQTPRALDLGKPMGTAVSGCKQGLVAAFLAKHYGGVVGVPVNTPLPTTTERGTQNQLVTANLIHLKNHTLPTGADEPMRTILGGGTHAALVYSFLVKYFGTAIGQLLDNPLHTVTGKDRFGLVTVLIEDAPNVLVPYVIVDIGMRMLTPRELARGQGFPDSYVMTGTNTSQVARIGNSVPPVMAKVLVEANYAPAVCQV